MEFRPDIQNSANAYVFTDGKSLFATRKVERYVWKDGKVVKSGPRPIVKTYASPFAADGQALAGSGALVFEGEVLNR